MKTPEQRFWEKVQKKGQDECWPWLGSCDKKGRGHFFKNDKCRVAPQVAWEYHNGREFPDGLFACHSCDNPNCVNPAHIWAGTRSENALDAMKKGIGVVPPSIHKGKTHCKRGHEFTEENTRHYMGARYCRACKRDTEKAKYWAAKLALLSIVLFPVSGCASLQMPSPPALENRTLRLSPDLPGFEYQYRICVAHFLFFCSKEEMKKEVYDLRDPEVRKQLISMGFVARVREKP